MTDLGAVQVTIEVFRKSDGALVASVERGIEYTARFTLSGPIDPTYVTVQGQTLTIAGWFGSALGIFDPNRPIIGGDETPNTDINTLTSSLDFYPSNDPLKTELTLSVFATYRLPDNSLASQEFGNILQMPITGFPPATTVTAGSPGTFGPAGTTPPTTLAQLQAITPTGGAWTVPGQHVLVGGQQYHWNGNAWVAGQAPTGTGHWDWSHGSPPRWTGDPLTAPATIPTLAEQTAHGPLIDVEAGDTHGYALTADGRIVAFGPDALNERKDLPTQGGFVQAAAGGPHGYALTADGHIVAFGHDSGGERVDLPTTGGFVQVAGGDVHGYALTADGHIVAFGKVSNGQRRDLPTQGGFVQVTAGDYHGYALTADGHIVAFGATTTNQRLDFPTQGGFVQVSADGYHGYALTADGHIVAFGHDSRGERKDLPTQGGFVQVVAGVAQGYALTADGHIVAFGSTTFHERKDLPTQGGFVQVSAGGPHGYALTADGHIVAFGREADERKDLPLCPVTFDHHPYVEDSQGEVTVHLAAGPAATVPNNAPATFPTLWPWEIDWGDGTPNTPVPVGTTAATVFVHDYAGVTGDKTLRIVYPAATRASAAGNPVATAAIDTATVHHDATHVKGQYVFVYDTADSLFHPAEAKVMDGGAWHDAEVSVFDSANGAWVK